MKHKKRKVISVTQWKQLVNQTLTSGEFVFPDCQFYRNPQLVSGYGSTFGSCATLSLLRFDSGHLRGALTKPHWNIDGSHITNFGSLLFAKPFMPENHILSSVLEQFSTEKLSQEKQEEINKFQYILINS